MKKAVIYFEPPTSEIAEMRRILSEADIELTVHSDFGNLGAEGTTQEELIGTVDGVNVALLGGESFNAAVIAAARDLQVISRIGVGFDRVDLEAARSRGIPVVVAAGSNHVTVAEFAFGLILALSRGTVRGHNAGMAGEWGLNVGTDLRGKSLGVAGLGRIGRTLVRQASGFEMRILALEISPDMEFVDSHGVTCVDLDTLCRESDFLSLHLPLDSETRGLIDAERLAMMKRTAYLVNTARGGLVDEVALHAAVTSGRIAGAGLDVFEREPPCESPLVGLDNVLISNHMAGVSHESIHRMLVMSAENAVAVVRGQWPREIVVNGLYSQQ